MVDYWIATFEVRLPGLPMEEVPTNDRVEAWALEVLRDKRGEYALLLSKADHADFPRKLQCSIGFANGAKSCSVWRDRGFPLVDAQIRQQRGWLTVRSPSFIPGQDGLDYDASLIQINGPLFQAGSAGDPFAVVYAQSQDAPDYAFPATWLRRKRVTWRSARPNASMPDPQLFKIRITPPKLPQLAPFVGALVPRKVWTGTLDLPIWPPTTAQTKPSKISRSELFGVPDFRFEDVEVIGFRLDFNRISPLKPAEVDSLLDCMTRRLNFHLSTTYEKPSDFRYEPATRTIFLEVLRYNRMRLKDPMPGLSDANFQSQHELLLRMLVGRVDDDFAQAHSPSTFVPAIFVDNPWSKVVGRNVQGFEKRLADFCAVADSRPIPLRPDGTPRRPNSNRRVPLEDVVQIDLAVNANRRPSARVLLEIEYPDEISGERGSFQDIDLMLAYAGSAFSPTRWRQDDFNALEFRRSFATSAIPNTLKGFRSIQVSPVGEAALLKDWELGTTWIGGNFVVHDGATLSRPNGTATLTFHHRREAPAGWRTLCKLLGADEPDQKEVVGFTSGNWYRMRCSMDLNIDNRPA